MNKKIMAMLVLAAMSTSMMFAGEGFAKLRTNVQRPFAWTGNKTKAAWNPNFQKYDTTNANLVGNKSFKVIANLFFKSLNIKGANKMHAANVFVATSAALKLLGYDSYAAVKVDGPGAKKHFKEVLNVVYAMISPWSVESRRIIKENKVLVTELNTLIAPFIVEATYWAYCLALEPGFNKVGGFFGGEKVKNIGDENILEDVADEFNDEPAVDADLQN